MTPFLNFWPIVCWLLWSSCSWSDAFFLWDWELRWNRVFPVASAILSFLEQLLHFGSECQKGNTAGFPVISWLGRAQPGDMVLAAFYLHRKGSTTWHWPLEIALQEGSCPITIWRFPWVQIAKNSKDSGPLTSTLNVANFWTQKLR